MEPHKPNPGGRPRGRGISSFIRDIIEEQDPASGQPKNKLIAKRLVEIALDPKTTNRDFLTIVQEMMDRLEGKPVNTNLNADITANPFEGIDTAKLEALKVKLLEIQCAKP